MYCTDHEDPWIKNLTGRDPRFKNLRSNRYIYWSIIRIHIHRDRCCVAARRSAVSIRWSHGWCMFWALEDPSRNSCTQYCMHLYIISNSRIEASRCGLHVLSSLHPYRCLKVFRGSIVILNRIQLLHSTTIQPTTTFYTPLLQLLYVHTSLRWVPRNYYVLQYDHTIHYYRYPRMIQLRLLWWPRFASHTRLISSKSAG